MKPFWDICEGSRCLFWGDHVASGDDSNTSAATVFRHTSSRAANAITLSRINLVAGLGPVLQIAEGWTSSFPRQSTTPLDARTDPTWPTTGLRRDHRPGRFQDGYTVMNAWAPIMAGSATVTSARTSSRWPRSCGFRWRCTMCREAEISPSRRMERFRHGGDAEGADFRTCANFSMYRRV